MAIINSLYFFLSFLILVLNHIKESNASVGTLSAAAASGANGGEGGIRSREHGREALVMQATSGIVGVLLIVGAVFIGYRRMKTYKIIKMEEKCAAAFESGKLLCASGNT